MSKVVFADLESGVTVSTFVGPALGDARQRMRVQIGRTTDVNGPGYISLSAAQWAALRRAAEQLGDNPWTAQEVDA